MDETQRLKLLLEVKEGVIKQLQWQLEVAKEKTRVYSIRDAEYYYAHLDNYAEAVGRYSETRRWTEFLSDKNTEARKNIQELMSIVDKGISALSYIQDSYRQLRRDKHFHHIVGKQLSLNIEQAISFLSILQRKGMYKSTEEDAKELDNIKNFVSESKQQRSHTIEGAMLPNYDADKFIRSVKRVFRNMTCSEVIPYIFVLMNDPNLAVFSKIPNWNALRNEFELNAGQSNSSYYYQLQKGYDIYKQNYPDRIKNAENRLEPIVNSCRRKETSLFSTD